VSAQHDPPLDPLDPDYFAKLHDFEQAKKARDQARAEERRPTYRERLLTVPELRDLPPPVPLISGIMDLDSLVLLYGARGSYKSFLGIDMGACIATGTRWHGYQVTQGNVLMVAAEGVGGLSMRFEAWNDYHALNAIPDGRFHILPEPVNMLAPASVGELAEAAVDIGAKFIILDTLARCMVGGDENSSRDGGMVIEQMDSIKRKTGACVMAVHHAGKNLDAGARGSSAFEAAADTVLSVSAEEGVVTIKQTKQKNHIEGNPFRLQATPQGQSIVLTDRHGGSSELPAGVLLTLAALSDIEVTGGVAAGAWALSSPCSEATFWRHRAGLINQGLVSNVGSEKMPRYQVTDLGTLTLSEHSQELS
jgi:hypothetical protein